MRAYERSGLQQRTFCDRHGVSLGTFQHWLYRLRKEKQPTSVSTALVKVELPATASAQPLEAGLPSGVVLRFAAGTEPRYVAAQVSEIKCSRC